MTNMIREIRDFNNPELDIYARYSENQLFHINEPAPGIFIAESPKVILRALDAGYEPLSILMEKGSSDVDTQTVLEKCPGVPVYVASLDVLVKLTGFQLTRGLLCAMRRKALPTLREICHGKKRIAILEEVVNPTNVGAIIRSAAALSVEAVILTSGCSDPLYRRAARVSMGTVFQIPWTVLGKNEWQDSAMACLRENGFKTAAMALTDESVSIDDDGLMSEEKLAIILGTEGEGLLEETIRACDYTVKIPMSHGVDSLNVAAASAVAFWQLCNRNV